MPYLDYKNIRLHYFDKGEGPVVVFLHGFLEDLSMWESIIPAFDHYRCICIDLLGHGETENLGPIHRMEDQAKLVKYVLDQLNISKVMIVGHSMGGYIALAFAELSSDRLNGICLMNSTAQEDSEEKKLNRERGIKAARLNYKTFVRVAIPNLFSPENQIKCLQEIRQISNKAVLMKEEGIIAALAGMKIRPDRTHLFDKKGLQFLMVIGKQDPALDYQQLISQANQWGVEKVVFPDGHMSHIENREELTLAIKSFAATVYPDFNKTI